MTALKTSFACLLVYGALEVNAAAQIVTFDRDDFAASIGARAIVSTDFNRDGWTDVAQANADRNSITILLNDAGSRLVRRSESPVGTGAFDLTAGDFNRDGIPDLAVANADSNSISILLGRGDGSFSRADISTPSQNPRGITTGDINHDGRPDVVFTGYATGSVRVLLGNGAGGFTAGKTYTAAGTQPQGVAIADFTHSGHPEVVVACRDGLRILSGMDGATVTARTLTLRRNLNVLAVGDLNADGWADVAAASTAASNVSVYLGGASGVAFANTYAVGISPRGISFADLNSDGRLDIATANRSTSTVSVLAANPTTAGRFLAHQDFAAASGSRAIVTVDFDHDGRVDVATGNQYATVVTVLSNATALEKAAFSFSALTLPSSTPLGAQDFLDPDSRFSSVPQIATADMNRDGRLDLIVPAGPTTGSSAVLVMLRSGATVTLTGPAPLAGFVVDDFNVDGNPDVLYYSSNPVAPAAGTRFMTFLGDGRGRFAASPATVVPQSLVRCGAGNLNRDSRPDLVCDEFVLLGNGNGTFQQAVAFAAPGEGAFLMAPAFGDVNRDGKLDLIAGFVYFGDGAGGLTRDTSGNSFPGRVFAAIDLNRDGYIDLVVGDSPDSLLLFFGSATGFDPEVRYNVLEDLGAVTVADVNADGHPDIVINGSTSIESSGVVQFLLGSADGTFVADKFLLRPGPVVATDVNSDGLPDLASYDAHAVHVLVNERNETNHPPVAPSYSLTSGSPCVTLEAKVTDPDQQLVIVEWFDPSGALLSSGRTGDDTGESICVEQPGTYMYRRTATDTHGAKASSTVTFTYQVTLKEIVLYAAAGNVQMTGNWSRVGDATAAGGFRAHDRNLGTPKVTQPSATPSNTLEIPFVADPNLTYKLWIRLKADGNSWANDSVWVQFTGGATAPYTAGTTIGLAVNLEECTNCGESAWGWEDDGYGLNRNGVLLRFDPGPQTIVIQTREDGVSIDQVVLSAEKYLTKRPGAAKNDQTILPATTGP